MMASNTAMANRWLDHLQHNLRRAPSTIHRYRNKTADFLAVVKKPIGQLTVSDLNDYVGRTHARGHEVAPATVAHDVAVLKSFFGFLHDEGLITANPAKRLVSPNIANDDPKPCPEGLWLKVWNSDLDDAERVAFGLAYFCGLRRQEVTGLRVHQFLDVPAPIISGLKRKGGGRTGFRWRSCLSLYEQRLPHLLGDPQLFLGALGHLRNRPADKALMPWRDVVKPTFRKHAIPDGAVPPEMFNYHMERRLAQLGIEAHSVRPHMLRHGFGTNLCRVGVDIQVVSRLMGHTNVNITMRYVDVGVDPLGKFLSTATDEDELTVVSPWGE